MLDSSASPLPPRSAYISFPGASYTHHAALSAARRILSPHGWSIIDASLSSSTDPPLQPSLYLADYDILPFQHLLPSSFASASSSTTSAAQCSSYVIRKALIRKHYLASSLHTYAVKQRDAARTTGQNLKHLTPKTWAFEIQFADELDELLVDDLYYLNEVLLQNEEKHNETDVKWFILKPGMADRGNGIRLFSTVEQLQAIFQEFEPDSDDEEEELDEDHDDQEGGTQYAGKDTSIMASQLRHFVIQEYLSSPLLLNPQSSLLAGTLSGLTLSPSVDRTLRREAGRKFHLRAYVLCVGSLSVYLHDSMLALFAPLPYVAPTPSSMTDLRPHLTNTCLQPDGSIVVGVVDDAASSRPKEENVWLWSDLVGSSISSASPGATQGEGKRLTKVDVEDVKREVVEVLGTTFKACAKAGSVHWQMWPNAFEIFGVDLMVSHVERGQQGWDVKVLEVNAQPDFAQTGSRLSETIDHLFRRTLQIAVLPFHATGLSTTEDESEWQVGESRDGTTLCFSEVLSKGF